MVPIMVHFGSPMRSMNTLFRAISGGVTWEGPANALYDIGWEWVFIFTFYVAFCCFAASWISNLESLFQPALPSGMLRRLAMSSLKSG